MTGTYWVNSIFDTMQGEGERLGQRSVFVRFRGCNLWDGLEEHRAQGRGACAAWCDTSFRAGEPLTTDALLQRMDALWQGPVRWCVLTGGEPLLQVDEALLWALCDQGWRVAIETNGTIALNGRGRYMEWITCSPKIGGEVAIERCDELKVVLGPPGFDTWTPGALDTLARKLEASSKLVVPMDPDASPEVAEALKEACVSPYVETVQRCVAFVKTHPDWRLGIQAHKVWRLA